MNKILQTTLKIAISGLLIIYVIKKVSLHLVLESLKATNWWYVPLIVAVFLLAFAIKALNFRLYTTQLKPLSFPKLFRISVLSWAAGMFAPGKVGEFSAIYFLKKEGIPLGTATAIIITDKLISISTLTALAAAGLLAYLDTKTAIRITSIAVAVLATVVVAIASRHIRALIRKFVLRKHESRFAGFSTFLFSYILKNKRLVLYNYCLAVLWTVVSATMIWLGILATGTSVPLAKILLINSASTIVSITPLTIGGLGARETTAVLLFEKAGYATAPILSGYLVITVISNLIALGVSAAAIVRKK